MNLNKYPAEVRTYSFDFSQMDELLKGDRLSSVVSVTATPSGLTIGTGIVVGKTVQFTISGGSVGANYEIICVVQTAGGSILAGSGFLYVNG